MSGSVMKGAVRPTHFTLPRAAAHYITSPNTSPNTSPTTSPITRAVKKEKFPNVFYVFGAAETSPFYRFFTISARRAEKGFWTPFLRRGAPKMFFGLFSAFFYVVLHFLRLCNCIFSSLFYGPGKETLF